MTGIGELPAQLPLFPVRGCILVPGEHLPLNVFEPRYLNMADDAMAGDGLIAMIQPRPDGPRDRPRLERIGTAGRIASFSETDDGRYLIVLTGLVRFTLTGEADRPKPYRTGLADYRGFEDDLAPVPANGAPAHAAFLGRLRRFFGLTGVEADWASIEHAPLDRLTARTAMCAPFDSAAKQALLAAPTPQARAALLAGYMDAALDSASGRA